MLIRGLTSDSRKTADKGRTVGRMIIRRMLIKE
jgi:hypothetical protein